MGKLTVRKCNEAAVPGRYGDGDTLYLVVAPRGSKSWVQRIRIDGRRRDMGLGPYPLVSLAEARDLAIDNRRAIRDGRNPLQEKRQAQCPTFRDAAAATFEANRRRWRNAKVAANWQQRLEKYAMPTLADLRVDRIGRADLLRILKPIWTEKPETAKKVRDAMRTVLAWAEAHGYVGRNLAGDPIAGALPQQTKKGIHHRALPYGDVPAALDAIAGFDRASLSARLALRFLILTASRSGTVRQAVWQEIDFKARIWSIPGVRMKTGADHVVPLADAAIVCLREAEALRSRHSDLIFPSPVRRGRAMSDMTLTQVLRKVKLDDVPIAQRAVVHGFRTSFRVWASEQTNADHAVMELSLGHAVGAKVERAYARSDLLAKRRRLLDQWAAFATGITVDADVVPLRA